MINVFFILAVFSGYFDVITTIIGIEFFGMGEHNMLLKNLLNSTHKISKISYITIWFYKLILLFTFYILSLHVSYTIFTVLMSSLFWAWFYCVIWNVKLIKQNYNYRKDLCEDDNDFFIDDDRWVEIKGTHTDW
jgi:hypothetical protein